MTDQKRLQEAERYYRLGNQYRRQDDWQHAMECYNTAIELDATSPAAKAREMLVNVMNYYCKDMFNP